MSFIDFSKVKFNKWKTLNDENVLFDDVIYKLKQCGTKKLYIGSDSQIKKRQVKYVTVIAVHTIDTNGIGHGGFGFYNTFINNAYEVDKINNTKRRITIRERITNETWMSLNLVYKLSEYFPNIEFEIHCDINPNIKYESSMMVKEVIGLVTGQGYNCKVKPESWCSMEVSDRKTK